MPSVVDQRLASLLHLSQIERVARTERIADAAERIVRQAVREWIAAARRHGPVTLNPSPREVLAAVNRSLGQAFVDLAAFAHSSTVDCYARGIPRRWLRRITPATILVGEQTVDLGLGFAEFPDFLVDPPEPVVGKRLSDADWADFLKKNVFAPPPASKVEEIILRPVQGVAWPQRVEALSRLVQDPTAVAAQLRDGYAAGESLDQLQRRVQPLADNWASSARRIARTEGLRIAEEVQRETYGELGPLMAGLQIVATLDERTRPAHRLWHGRIYWQDARRKPHISEFPALPAGPNCRCMSVPVLKPPKEFETDPAVQAQFRTATGATVPDPSAYSDWFARADVGRRKLAVGATRYTTVQRLLGGREPQWQDFVDRDGGMLSVDKLRGETQQQRDARVAAVSRTIADRMRLLGQVSRYGFATNNPPPLAAKPPTLPATPPPKPPTLPAQPIGITGKRPAGMPVEKYLAESDELNRLVDDVIKAGRQSQIDQWTADAKQRWEEHVAQSARLQEEIRQAKLQRKPSKVIARMEREWRAGVQAAEDAYDDAQNRIWEAKEAGKLAAKAAITLPESERLTITIETRDDRVSTVLYGKRYWSKPVGTEVESTTLSAASELSRYTKTEGKELRVFLREMEDKDGRAFARQDEIWLSRSKSVRVAAHELGHVIETMEGRSHDSTQEFVRYRVRRSGTQNRTMRDLTGDNSWDASEIGNEDDFRKLFGEYAGYAGKTYNDGTELISMGVEKLLSHPAKLARDDPEFFKMLIGHLRGLL